MLKFFDFNNLKKQPVPSNKEDSAKGIIKWQTNASNANDFPQQLLQNVYNSPVGSAAIDIWQEYVEGDGLLDTSIGETKVNREQDLNELHALLSADLSSMWGLAFIVRYDVEGNRVSYTHLPFEETRLGIPNEEGRINKIYHNPYYGIPKDFDDKDTRWFYSYDPDNVVREIQDHNTNPKHLDRDGNLVVKYPGQVYWFSIEKPLARVYPQPFYYSSIRWFQVDAEIQSFHERNIKNNMLLSVLMNVYGNPDDPAGPSNGKNDDSGNPEDQRETMGEVFNKQMQEFSDLKGGVMTNWYQREEEKAEITPFPTNSNHDLFIALQNITSDQIAIGTKTPRVLLNIATAGKLGDTQEVLNAVRMMQGRTVRMRNILKKIYETVIGVEDGNIKNVNPVNVIPDLVWNSLSVEEQRNYIFKNFDIEELGGEVDQPDEEIIENPGPVDIKIHNNGS